MIKLHSILLMYSLVICGLFTTSLNANEWMTTLDEYYEKLDAQLTSDPDSVLNKLNSDLPINDTMKIKAQHHLLLSYTYNVLVVVDKAMYEAEAGLNYVDEKTEPWLYHKMQLAYSQAKDSIGSHSKGIKGANEALKWAIENKDKKLESEALTTQGYIFLGLLDYSQALSKFQEAYKLAGKLGDASEFEISSAIALIYEMRREHALSVPFFQKSVDYHRKNNNWIELSIGLYGLGRANGGLGDKLLAKKQLQESADISLRINDNQGVAYAWKELAGIEMLDGNLSFANKLLNDSLDLFKESNNIQMLFDVNTVLSRLSLKLKKPEKAKNYIDKALSYINPDNQQIQYISAQKQIALIYSFSEDYEKAYTTLWNVMIKEKSLLAKQSTEELHQIRTKYETENKDNANKILSQENELNKIKFDQQQDKNKSLKIQYLIALLAIGFLLFMSYRLRQTKKHFEHLANFDGLTGLYTRSKILELLAEAFETNKIKNEEFIVVMIDLDFFKKINDEFGHMVGDQVLQKFGELCCALKGFCGRFGGEEFILGLPNVPIEQAKEMLNKLQVDTHRISSQLNLTSLSISFSAGVCTYVHQNNIDEMIKCADEVLYKAKVNGRNRIETN